MTDSAVVPTGDTLTIDPGVDVLIDTGVPLVVEGSLQAMGTPTDSIRFLPMPSLAPDSAYWHGITLSGSDSSTIQYARVSGAREVDILGGTPHGGAFTVYGAHAGITGCNLSGDEGNPGGGLYIGGGGSVIVNDCRFFNNSGKNGGGGIYVDAGSYVFVDNSVVDSCGAASGGGIYVTGTSVAELDDCTVEGNTAAYGGGAYCSDSAVVTMRNCVIIANGSTTPGDGNCGGIYLTDAASLALSNCAILNNVATFGGIGLDIWGARASLYRTIIAGNHALPCPDQLCTASYAGGIAVQNWNGQASLAVESSTIARNHAVFAGGIWASDTASVTLHNTIVRADSQTVIHSGRYATVTATYCDIQNGLSGIGNIDADPAFADASTGDFNLQSSSPCIDAGDPSSPPDPDGSRADMGAIYYDHIIAAVAVRPQARTVLGQPCPNPFNPSVSVYYVVGNAGPTTIRVYNLLGQPVRTLLSGAQAVGNHVVVWNGLDDRGRRAASGLYFIRMESGTYTATREIALVR